MHSINIFACSTALLVAVGATAVRADSAASKSPTDFASPRQRVLMDAGWKFRREPGPLIYSGTAITDWEWTPGAGTPREAAPPENAAWKKVAVGTDVFAGKIGNAWFRTTLPSGSALHTLLHFESVDDNAAVFLNGKFLTYHRGWNDSFDVTIGPAWVAGGPNVLTVLVENTAGGGGILGAVMLGDGTAAVTLTSPDAPGWRTVHLPHDYVVEGTFSPNADPGHGSLPTEAALYEKAFTLPASDRGKSIWIDFDGVYRASRVYLNGRLLGTHASGYTPFRFDIGSQARYGAPNLLAVYVDPRAQEGWWYEGGGIYRHVWLNVASPLHVAPWGVYVRSAVEDASGAVPSLVESPLGSPPARLTIETDLVNAASVAGAATLVSHVIAPDGHQVAVVSTPLSIAPGERQEVLQTAAVPSSALWSLRRPQLYTLRTQVVQSGSVVDSVGTTFGIRTITFDAARGFFLNGEPVKIQGTCNHQDFAGIGIAVPDSLEYWRVKQLQAMGSNAWRTSHNPPTESVLDACDRLGMLVMDENRHLGDTFSGKTPSGTPTTDLSELDDMILRDRNHPSVIMWSMCNEEPLQGTEEGARIFMAMRDRVLSLDPTRPVSCAMSGGYPNGITQVEDLQGINYSPWAYDGFHKDHPLIPLYSSETGSTVSTRGIYSQTTFRRRIQYTGVPDLGYVSAYDTNAPGWAQTAENAWQPIMSDPYVAGGFVWTGFDYKGEPTPFDWPDINSNFGILDMCGFPKDLFYYYQSIWGDKSMVHILPHWNWAGQEGQPISVWVYSNAVSVDLRLNGTSLGVKAMPAFGHLEWTVPYAPGKLEAIASRNGAVVATDTVETTGAPAALRLHADRTVLTADGEDLIPVEVDVVDAQGRVVPTAANQVIFAVTGAGQIDGVGNGDPSDHDPDKSNMRKAFNGKGLVDVGASDHPGPIKLTATAPGLTGASMAFAVR